MSISRAVSHMVCASVVWAVCNEAPGQAVPEVALQEQVHHLEPAVVITFDPDVLPLNADLINATLREEQLWQRAMDNLETSRGLDELPMKLYGIQFSALESATGKLDGRLAGRILVKFAMDPLDAGIEPRQVWQAFVRELEDSLSATAKRLNRQHEVKSDVELELLSQMRDKLTKNLEEALEHAVDAVPVVDVSEEMRQLWTTRREVSLHLAGIEARRQAIQERMEEIKSSGRATELDQKIIEELEKIVSFEEQQRARLSKAYERGAVTETELAQAEAELAQARIELLRAKKEAAVKSTPDIAGLADELTQATIQAAEQRAILKEIESSYEQLKNALSHQVQSEQQSQAAEDRVAMLREKLATIESRLAALEIERIKRESARGATVQIIPWSE